MKYIYQAIDRSGKRFQGEVDVDGKAAALRHLARQGLTPLKLEEQKPRQFKSSAGRRRLKAEELNMALYELATMLSAGVSLGDAVEAQESSTSHPRIAAAWQTIAGGLRQGESFPTVLQAAKLPLPRYVYQLVAAGEMTGNLAGALRDCVQQMEYERRTRDEIRSALIYPSILVLSGIVAVATMFVFVVPKFANLLEQPDQLPWLAWVVLSTGTWSHDHVGLLLFMLAGLGVAIYLGLSNDRFRSRLLNGVVRLPVIGDWLMQSEIAQWSKVLGTLLGNRVALVDALTLSAEGVRIDRQREMLERVTQDVRGGAALSAALSDRQAITATGSNLIRVGEKSGRLAEMLNSLAGLYQELGQSRMKKVLALIEPLAILVIGAVFGLIITGVVLAITSANDIVL